MKLVREKLTILLIYFLVELIGNWDKFVYFLSPLKGLYLCLESNMVATSGLVTVVLPGYNMGQLLTNNYKMLEEPKLPTPMCLICTVVMKYLNSEIKDKSNQVCFIF